MSGPLSPADAPASPRGVDTHPDGVEVLDGRDARVGAFAVRRLLPRRPRRTVGAWCFVDHLGPGEVDPGHGLDIGPHPHIGLQTVTWLLRGEVRHRDSLGSDQVIRPGQLNLMTAGRGVAHAEEAVPTYTGTLHGVQLWVAQPEATRHGEPAFEHHPELPRTPVGDGVATVLVGQLGGARSPARRDTEHVGVDLDLPGGRAAVPLDPRFEHALAVLEGTAAVAGRDLRPGQLGHLDPGRDEVAIEAPGPARILLLGGVPFPDPLLMWWNYVARTRPEITAAHRAWQAGDARFGPVASPLARLDAPGPPWADDPAPA